MAKSTNQNNTLLWICRLAVGVLFIFSGLIKANDPLGFSYKLDEYFEVFHLLSLSTFSLLISVLLCALEVILGFALLIGWRAKTVTWGLLLLIIFFGFLTFYSAWFKVVQSCGCFGDAIPLTPWQSFAKDMALLLLVLVPFAQRRNISPLVAPKTMRNLFVASVIVAFGVGIYTYNFLPVIDFLPYKVGNNLPEQMATPPGAKPDEYELTYHMVNKKSGEKKDITDKEYLKTGIWKDASWEIKGDPESRLVKKGFTPKIRDLVIQDAQGNDYTQELLANPFNSLWIVAYNLNQTDEDAIDKLNAVAINLIQNYNTRVVLLTSTSHETAEKFAKAHHLSAEIFYADGVPLKTMVRSNPGVMLMKKGTVLGKWHYHTVPSYDNLVKDFFQK